MRDDWQNFAVMIGGASGALTGLLFVAVSLNRDVIVAHPRLRASAAQTLMLFLVPLLVGAALLVPHQVRAALGLELIATAVGTAWVLLNLGRSKRLEKADRVNTTTFLLAHRSANLVAPVFAALAGALWWARVDGALYWLVPATLTALVQGVLNAWLFLVARHT